MQEVDVAVRFTEERKRLGYSQNAFARLTGRSREGIRRVEMGLTEAKGATFLAAARLGLDVQYVLTGVRSGNLDEVIARIGYAANNDVAA